MPKPGAAISRFGSLIALVACSLLAMCSEPTPVVYALGEPIPLIVFELKVVRTESIPSLHPYAGSIFDASSGATVRDGEKAVAVHVNWKGIDRYDGAGIDLFLKHSLYVIDDAGDRYKVADAISRREFMGHYSMIGEQRDRDFVVIFIVHEDSRALVLHIEHPDPPDDGSRLMAIPLDT
jgi:hypothetical protein